VAGRVAVSGGGLGGGMVSQKGGGVRNDEDAPR
jgi:hypothetical protein